MISIINYRFTIHALSLLHGTHSVLRLFTPLTPVSSSRITITYFNRDNRSAEERLLSLLDGNSSVLIFVPPRQCLSCPTIPFILFLDSMFNYCFLRFFLPHLRRNKQWAFAICLIFIFLLRLLSSQPTHICWSYRLSRIFRLIQLSLARRCRTNYG